MGTLTRKMIGNGSVYGFLEKFYILMHKNKNNSLGKLDKSNKRQA